eukprot:TRINITY_DN7328_c0_g1_i8.p1 TRINITY_DN7328_c0_g1~~TRINITY_DN7328_c0_g1_i8.p1  ORF type:complete len:199 (-),score=37.57 TRINITY_DN7328_c0_g1_i8:48-566(-)
MKINPNSAEGPVPAKIPWTFPPNPMCYFPFTNPMMATQSRNGSIPPAPVGGLPAEPTRLNQEEEKKQHGNSQAFPKIPGANPSITIPTGSFPRSVTELSQMQYYQMMQYQAQYMAMMNYYQSIRPPSNRPPDPDSKSQSLSLSPVSYTHLRAHETSLHLVCRLLLEKKKKKP